MKKSVKIDVLRSFWCNSTCFRNKIRQKKKFTGIDSKQRDRERRDKEKNQYLLQLFMKWGNCRGRNSQGMFILFLDPLEGGWRRQKLHGNRSNGLATIRVAQCSTLNITKYGAYQIYNWIQSYKLCSISTTSTWTRNTKCLILIQLQCLRVTT